MKKNYFLIMLLLPTFFLVTSCASDDELLDNGPSVDISSRTSKAREITVREYDDNDSHSRAFDLQLFGGLLSVSATFREAARNTHSILFSFHPVSHDGDVLSVEAIENANVVFREKSTGNLYNVKISNTDFFLASSNYNLHRLHNPDYRSPNDDGFLFFGGDDWSDYPYDRFSIVGISGTFHVQSYSNRGNHSISSYGRPEEKKFEISLIQGLDLNLNGERNVLDIDENSITRINTPTDNITDNIVTVIDGLTIKANIIISGDKRYNIRFTCPASYRSPGNTTGYIFFSKVTEYTLWFYNTRIERFVKYEPQLGEGISSYHSTDHSTGRLHANFDLLVGADFPADQFVLTDFSVKFKNTDSYRNIIINRGSHNKDVIFGPHAWSLRDMLFEKIDINTEQNNGTRRNLLGITSEFQRYKINLLAMSILDLYNMINMHLHDMSFYGSDYEQFQSEEIAFLQVYADVFQHYATFRSDDVVNMVLRLYQYALNLQFNNHNPNGGGPDSFNTIINEMKRIAGSNHREHLLYPGS